MGALNIERGLRNAGQGQHARAVEKGGNRRTAEAGLKERAERVEGFHLRSLAGGDRARFAESWRGVQARFVNGPAGAVTEADQLVGDVMSTRGYPVSNFEQRAADISVDQANTEDLRQAMVHYWTLFEELISEPAS